MDYTQLVELELTSAPLEYNKQIRKMLTTSDLKEALGNYQDYRERFKQQLEVVRSHFCSGRFGFALISLICKKYLEYDKNHPIFAKLDSDDNNFITFAIQQNTIRVRTINTPEDLGKYCDLDAYSELLTSIGIQYGRIRPEDEKRFKSFYRNLLNKDFGKNISQQEAKNRILEACYYLSLNATEAEHLLLRYGDSLCANNLDDAIWGFILDVPGKLDDREVLHKLYEDAHVNHTNETQLEQNSSGTYVSYQSLRNIIKDHTKTHAEKLADYANTMAEHTSIFNRASRSARDMLEHLLLYAARGLGWKDPILEALSESVLRCKAAPLTAKQRERLVLAILTGPATTKENLFGEKSISFPYHLTQSKITYPIIDEDIQKIKQLAMGERLLHLLDADERVTKNDIIYAVFLVTLYASSAGSDPVADYNYFKKICDIILKQLLLPGFYVPHLLEFTAGKALLAGKKREEAYLDVIHTFNVQAAENISNETEHIWEDSFLKIAEKSNIPKSYSKFENSVKNHLKTLSFTEEVTGISAELFSIGEKIYFIWEGSGFLGFKMTISNGSAQIKIELKERNPFYLDHVMSKDLFAFLHEKDKEKDKSNLKTFRFSSESKTLHEFASQYKFSESDKKEIPKTLYSILTAEIDKQYGIQIGDPEAEATLPQCAINTINAYKKLSKKCNTLGEFLTIEPDWNRRCRRMAAFRMIEAILMHHYGLEEIQRRVNQLKGSTGTVPAGFRMPVILVKENASLTVDTMDKEDIEFYLRRKRIGSEKSETPAEDDFLSEQEPKEDQENEYKKSKPKKQSADKKVSKTQAFEHQTAKVTIEQDDEDDEEDFEKLCNIYEVKPKDPVRQYYNEIRYIEKLNPEEEHVLAKLAKTDANARDKLICANLKSVYYIALRMSPISRIPVMDLVSAGHLGLVKACDRFDSEKGAKLSTYASHNIRYFIQKEIDANNAMKIPRDVLRCMREANKYRSEFYMNNGRLPSDAEVAAHLRIPLEKLPRDPSIHHLDAYINQDEDETTLGELIPDEQASVEVDESVVLFKTILAKGDILSPREEEVLRMHHGLLAGDTNQDYFTFSSIAEFLGISLSDAILAEMSALRKIRLSKKTEKLRKLIESENN